MMKQIERHVFVAVLAMVLKAIKRPCDADWFSGLRRMKNQLRHMTWENQAEEAFIRSVVPLFLFHPALQ